jgi:hypothetical protein
LPSFPVSMLSSQVGEGRSNSAKMALASSNVRSADVVRWNVLEIEIKRSS